MSSMSTKTPKIGPSPYTPEWYALRKLDRSRVGQEVVWGASEAAVAINRSPYSSPFEACLRKMGEIDEIEDNAAMAVGRALEPVVLDLYQKRTGLTLIRTPPMFFHPDHSFCAATPDAIVTDRDEWVKAVDAKTTTYHRYDKFGASEEKYGEEGSDQLPIDIICQAQQQMAVCGLNKADFPVLFDTRTLRIYTVEFIPELWEEILKAEKELTERIIANDLPEPNWSLASTTKLLQDRNGLTEGKVVEIGAYGKELWLNYRIMGDAITSMTADRTAIKNNILAIMGDAELGSFGDKELRRCTVAPTYVTDADVAEYAQRLGKIKRSGHERLLERKRR